MENEYPQQDAYAPSAPPTYPGALPQPQRMSKWPTILGVIAIVLGVLGVLGAVWGFVAPYVISGVMPDMPPEVVTEIERTKAWNIIGSGLGLALGLLLAVTGVGLTNRRRWSVTTARIWAGLKMILVVVGLGVGWAIQSASFESNPATAQAGSGFMLGVQVFSVVFGLAWGWALPVFMLVWLSRSKIKAETDTWN